MVNLSNYSIYVKMAIDGVTRPAFSAITLPPHHYEAGNRENIINASRKKYAQDRELVEEKIKAWSAEPKKEEKEIKEEAALVEEQNKTLSETGYRIIKDINRKKWYIKESGQEEMQIDEQAKIEPTTKDDGGLITADDLSKISSDEDKDNTNKPKELKAGEIVKIDST